MSGHSKWANIKRKKEAKDKVKGNIFTKMSRLITIAVIEGGGVSDENINVKLRLAIDQAKKANMPKDTIKRAIEKGTGPNKLSLSEVLYEGFAPAGVALIILAATDNQNRTLANIRVVCDRNGGKLGGKGSVSYFFKKCGLITFLKEKINEDDVFIISEKLNAIDINQDKDFFYVYIPFEELGRIQQEVSFPHESAELDYKPFSYIKVNDEKQAQKILSLIQKLEELDDVQQVFSNFDIYRSNI